MEKFGDIRPNRRDRFSEPAQDREPNKGEPSLSRRALLRAAFRGALAATVAHAVGAETYLRLPDIEAIRKDRMQRMRFDRFGDMSAQERETKIKDEVTRTRAFLRTPEANRIMNGGTEDDVSRLLSMLPPLLREHIEGTSYEVSKDAWPSVVLAGGTGRIATRTAGISPASGTDPHIGNAVYLGNNEFLTNWHVLSASLENGTIPPSQFEQLSRLVKLSAKKGFDVVRVTSGPEVFHSRTAGEKPKAVRPLPQTKPDSVLNGTLVTVAGIDPDGSSAPDGTKVYPSVAIKVTKHMATFFASGNSKWLRRLENSYLYLMPPGESRDRPFPSSSPSRLIDFLRSGRLAIDGDRYGAGMSGSPVMMGDHLVGINHSGAHWEHKGTTLDIGFFHPISKVREAIKSGMNYDTTTRKATVYSRF